MKEMLLDVARLELDYFERRPDLQDPNQLVSFGTRGHRGSPSKARLLKHISSPLHRQFATIDNREEQMVRSLLAKIPTHLPALYSALLLRYWRQTTSRS